MSYPSTISAFVNPSPSDRLSTTPHSSIETAQNTDLVAIETFVGTLSSLQGTLVYDIRAANSNGGGHVQTANLGGTGQTTFTKGDILVAQSSSVLTKLSVGADGTVPTANSGAAAGMSWQGVANATNIQNQTYTYARASVMSASVYGINLSQAVSVLTDGMGFVIKFPTTNTNSVLALSVNATGPSSVSALIKNPDLSNIRVGGITSSMIGVVEFDSVSSVFQLIAPVTKSGYFSSFIGSKDNGGQYAQSILSGATLAIVSGDAPTSASGQVTLIGGVVTSQNITSNKSGTETGLSLTWTAGGEIVSSQISLSTFPTWTAYFFK